MDVEAAVASHGDVLLAFPKILGCFSVDAERNYKQDLSALRYFACPPKRASFDLNVNFRHFVEKGRDQAKEEKLRHLLQFLARNMDRLKREGELRYDFVCFRGLLTKVMITPFTREDWRVCAMRFQRTVYLWSFEEERDFPNKEKFVFWGYNFENYVFSRSPHEKPDTGRPVNANEEFCVMFSTRIGDFSILYGAEVDGIDSEAVCHDDTLKNTKLVEVKTSRFIDSQRSERNFLMKTLKWFCQSYLVGIEDVYVGFRNDRGIVKEVTRCRVDEMPRKAGDLWDKKKCLKMLSAFLGFVRSVVKDDATYLFDYNCRDGRISVEKIEGVSEYSFLPEWCFEVFNKNFL